jgi:hypothetical protein
MVPRRHRGLGIAYAAVVAALVACRAPRPPVLAPPPPASCTTCAPPRRVAGSDLALVAGRWLGRDREQWRYDLDVAIDGTFTQTVQQDSGGLCVQEGRVDVRDRHVVRTFDSNDCNAAFVGETVRDQVVALDADRMIVRTDSGYEIEYERAR